MKSKSLSCDGEQPWHVQFCQPNPSARAEWLFAGIIDRALHHWGHVPLLTVDPVTKSLPTLRLTQRYPTTTSPLSPAIRLSLCSHQVSNCLVRHRVE